MAVYRFKALDREGKPVVEQMAAESRHELLTRIEKLGLYPVEIRPVADWKSLRAEFFNSGKKVTVEEIAFFCRQFHALFRAGLPIPECVHTIGIQTTNNKFKRIILTIQEKLQEGNTLSMALAVFPDVFPNLLLAMVEAGETAGYLEEVLQKMAVFYEREYRLKSRIKNASVYPKFLAVLSAVLVIFMLTFVMPTFVKMFEAAETELPGVTRAFIAAGDFLKRYAVLILLMLAALVAAALWFRKSTLFIKLKELWESLGFKIPATRDTLQNSMSARLSGALAMLLKSGIPMLQALDITSKVLGNAQGEKALRTVKEKVEKGMLLGIAIQEADFFPSILSATVRTGEGAGTLDEILEHISHYFEEELDKSLDRMLKLIEPLMIVMMALVIGTIVIAMILPMFNMITAIR